MAHELTHDVAVDIVITNHNYGDFVTEAIESALAQTHPKVEVIVVDDGSTDDSRERLWLYQQVVEVVLKEAGGQASAINAGVARCRGDIVMMLDADDLLKPRAAASVAAAFSADPAVVKVQLPMEVIDREGRPTGATKPRPYLPSLNGDLRRAELAFPFDLPWLPTSGNSFRIDALRRILPIPEADYPVCADGYLVHLTTLLGAVASLEEIGAAYRVHGRNSMEPQAPRLDVAGVRRSIGYSRAVARDLARLADELGLPRPDPILSMADLGSRLISEKLEPEAHPVPSDRKRRLVADAVRAARRRFDVGWPIKIGLVGWFAVTAVSPRPVARRLSELYLFPEQHAALTRLLRAQSGLLRR
jgi:hypothetical protein